MSSRSKSKREELEATALKKRAEAATRKREQRELFRTKYSHATTLRENSGQSWTGLGMSSEGRLSGYFIAALFFAVGAGKALGPGPNNSFKPNPLRGSA